MVWVETIVGALLSGFLQVLFHRMATRQFVDFFRKRFVGTDLLERLKMILLTVNVVLNDAEEKQITNPFVKEWVDELQNVVYKAEDFLDEIATLALAECQASNNPVQNSKSNTNIEICKTLQSRLEEIISKLENLAKHKDVLGLKESFGGKLYQRLPTTSLVDECKVYGFNKNKEKIMNFLLSVRENGMEIPVIAIVGMAGVGKTTLAQLLYNDSRMKKHFRTSAWAYVSEEFDVFKVTKTIYESVTSRDCNITDLNLIQIRLKEELVRKKFLLVLDDVWNENFSSWDFLQNSFKDGAKGSRIIVTTRSHSVASTMGATLTHSLQQLSYEDCWSVFETHAFRSKNSQTHPKLKPIGEKIVKKCQGLPLAAKIIGSLLHSKVEAHEWDNILNSKIWDLQNDKSNILPSLSLSYYYLPSHLKQCFAYCSILPKGYVFKQEMLVMLWMAEGFLQQPRDEKCMEEVGNRYFDELVSMSLFQKSGHKSGFVMHDLVNELAQFVSGEFCFHSESGELHGISEKTRHFSYARHKFDGPEKFEALNEAKFLRTFLPLSLSSNSSGSNNISAFMVHTLLPSLSSLRALSLSGYKMITTCPNDINKLKHLRFLDFSGTEIMELPESTCSLYNLQTLKLLDCFQLVKLPAKMRNLIQLGYLDLNGTRSLKELPPEFGRLKNLQILTTFVVSNNTGASCISELGGLLQIRGKLSILELQNVRDIADAENAKLKDKQYVKELAFHWDNNGHDQQKETDVLEKLRPHKNIEKISIEGYNGTKLPDWLGNSLFDNMVILRISDCKNCSSFPPLGQLSSLQELWIQKCPELIGKLPDHFPSLELLYIDQCCKLDFPSDDITDYRNLQVLQIKKSCGPLKKITLSFFNKLKYLEIQDCVNLNCIEISKDLHQELEFLEDFIINNCNALEEFSGGRMQSPKLTSLLVSNCMSLQSMPEHMNTPNLKSFSVSNCNSLNSMPKYMHAPNLISFSVSNCNSLQSMPEHMHTPKLTSNCNNLQPMPKHMHTPKLTSFSVSNCSSLQSMPEHMHAPNLTSFSVSNCISLRSMPKHMYTPKLTSFSVSNCNSLQSLPEHIRTPKLTSNCKGFQSMPKHMHTPKLTSFSVSNCNSLQSMPDHMHSPNLTSFSVSECNSLQSMPEHMHAPNLTSFSISNCNSLQQMPEQMNMLLTSLETLEISCCPKVESFPNVGLPPSLKKLLIQKCDRLTVHTDWGLNNMALLTCLTIKGGCSNVNSFPDEGLLPASLTIIQISEFPVLQTLNLKGLQDLALLKSLQINSCDFLRSFSVEGTLPSSLSSLNITGHSCLTQLCQKDVGEYWPKIRHIQIREINGDII